MEQSHESHATRVNPCAASVAIDFSQKCLVAEVAVR